ncbi:conserved hypothetical protein [Desulfarculus baarsii DSM 2075]|uniref:TIGR00725 family protein n=1 Tax=Desulfarculus baarsii (strain ATCC 33931 / DSM 2075 / LMG 7858 / VKM B-1802 / 2st14) TaxID=644282 RepID=E1QDB0_DESB2|nr:TIGR00725 family protein [Desulfarculus baarsii]ADK83429.1 conserved hypothetical protein [Desulfarculus baarsii DSM 2075]
MAAIRLVSVVGAGAASPRQYEQARQVGQLLAKHGLGVVCGGLGGVMEAACRGASEAGGLAVAILPGTDRHTANRYATVVIPSGLGQARNALVVSAGEGVIAIAGGPGTLSEIGFALKAGKPIVALDSWDIPGLAEAESPQEAVDCLIDRLGPA